MQDMVDLFEGLENLSALLAAHSDDPPVRESIIDHDRIASRTSFADTAKVRPQ